MTQLSRKRKNTYSAIIIFFGLILTAVMIILVLPQKRQTQAVITSQPNIIQEQALLEDNIIADYYNGTYSLQNPYIIQDPYGNSPLTALVIFDTASPAIINVLVRGKNVYSDLDYKIEGLQTHHEIPIVGLYPGAENEVELTLYGEDGSTTRHVVLMQTEYLPEDFPKRIVVVSQPEKMEPGWILVNSEMYKFILDANGDIRWFLNIKSNNILTSLPNRNLLMAYLPTPPYTIGDSPDKLVETNLLGKFPIIYFTPIIHHDVISYHNSYIGTVGQMIYEFDWQLGSMINRFTSLWDLLSVDRTFNYIEDHESLHVNTLVTGGDLGDDILVSARNQHALILLDYAESQLKMIIGIPDDWPVEFQSYLLTPVGDDFDWFWMQHAPKILPDLDQDPNSVDLLLFDNGTYRNHKTDIPKSEQYSRMVHYRINLEARTIEQKWEYGQERGFELFSSIKGDANYLSQTGNYQGTFAEVQSTSNMNSYDGVIVEVTNEKVPVFEVRFSDTRAIYRSERINMEDYIPSILLGEQHGKYLQYDVPYNVYFYPRVTDVTVAADYSRSFDHFCAEKIGNGCGRWKNRAIRYGLIKTPRFSPLDLLVDSVTLINNDLHIAGKLSIPEEQENNLFLVLSSENVDLTYDITSALLREPGSTFYRKPGEDGYTRFYVNYLNTIDIPAGEYNVDFFINNNQEIEYIETNYLLQISRLNGEE